MGNRIISRTIDLTNRGPDIVNKYITEITNEGIRIHPSSGNHYLQITSEIIDFKQNNKTVASFGINGSIIGNQEKIHVETTNKSFKMIDPNLPTEAFVHFSDLAEDNGTYIDTIEFDADGYVGSYGWIVLDYPFTSSDEVHVYYDNVETTFTVAQAPNVISVYSNQPSSGQKVKIQYETISNYIKAFTLGRRNNSIVQSYNSINNMNFNIYPKIGGMSTAIGRNTMATRSNSIAIGTNAIANAASAIAIGTSAEAHGAGSMALMSGIAYGERSYSMGYRTESIGTNSVAIGNGAVAKYANTFAMGVGVETTEVQGQAVLGEHNVPVNGRMFIIGNGAGDGVYRSNALEMDPFGNTIIAGTLTQSSDRRLKEHISYLNTDAINFIQSLKPAYFKKDKQLHLGFYAQDVEEIDTWNCMVGEMNGFKTLGYTEIIAPLVAYCQHLEERVKQLEEK